MPRTTANRVVAMMLLVLGVLPGALPADEPPAPGSCTPPEGRLTDRAQSVDFQLSSEAMSGTREEEIQKLRAFARLRDDRDAIAARVPPSLHAAEKVDLAKSVVPVGSIWFRHAFDNTYEVMGDVKNTGSRTYCFVKIKLDFRDSAGVLIATDWTYVNGTNRTLTSIDNETDTCLLPNEVGFFGMYVTLNYSRLDDTFYDMDFDTPDLSMPDARVFLSGGLRDEYWYGDTEISGTLKNGGTVSAVFCKINLALKSSSGAFLDVDLDYVDGSTIGSSSSGLRVGQSATFDTFTDAPYSSYSYADYKIAWDDYGNPPSCSYSLNPTSVSINAEAHVASVNLSASDASCSWTAESRATWLHVTSAGSGTGSAVVQFRIDENPNPSQRTGTLTIAGKTLTVTQAGKRCEFSVSPTTATFASEGGEGVIAVSAGSGCAWAVNDNASWIHITAGLIGSGDGTVEYTVDANQGTNVRSGTIAIADQRVNVEQAPGGPVVTESTYWLGGIASSPGSGGTSWHSSLMACNLNDEPVELELELHSEDGVSTAHHELPAHSSAAWSDVVQQLFMLEGPVAGAVRVSAAAPVLLAARTFNETAGGTLGQYMPAVTADDGFASGENAVLPHLKSTADFRTNVGVVNLSDQACIARVQLFGVAGESLGSTDGATIPAQGWHQFNRVFDLAHVEKCEIGRGLVEIIGLETGCTLWAYASVVDNVSGDPTTIPLVVE